MIGDAARTRKMPPNGVVLPPALVLSSYGANAAAQTIR